MDSAVVIDACYRALTLVLWLSLPAVLTSAIVGLGTAIVQAVTQIQDQGVHVEPARLFQRAGIVRRHVENAASRADGCQLYSAPSTRMNSPWPALSRNARAAVYSGE